jgi:hypothetical protein
MIATGTDMRTGCGCGPPPYTAIVDPLGASSVLDYRAMVALAGMFERWALTEVNITPERRTRVLQMCVDYEAIAAWCGPAWVAPDPDPRDPLSFLAQIELADQAEDDDVGSPLETD